MTNQRLLTLRKVNHTFRSKSSPFLDFEPVTSASASSLPSGIVVAVGGRDAAFPNAGLEPGSGGVGVSQAILNLSPSLSRYRSTRSEAKPDPEDESDRFIVGEKARSCCRGMSERGFEEESKPIGQISREFAREIASCCDDWRAFEPILPARAQTPLSQRAKTRPTTRRRRGTLSLATALEPVTSAFSAQPPRSDCRL